MKQKIILGFLKIILEHGAKIDMLTKNSYHIFIYT